MSQFIFDLLTTYPHGVTLGNDENTYDILLNDSTDTVSVPAKSSKTVYYQFSNTNKGTVKYHIGYTSNNVIAKVWWDTEDPIFGTIEYGKYKYIKLKLINDSTSDDTITIKPVLGYVNGGDVIPDSSTLLVTDTIKETNTFSGSITANLGISSATIEEIYFNNDNIVPGNALGSAKVTSDGSIMKCYTDIDEDELYEVYVGSDNGITKLTSLRETFVKIYLKDTQGNRDFMSNNFSSYTNVQYIPSS